MLHTELVTDIEGEGGVLENLEKIQEEAFEGKFGDEFKFKPQEIKDFLKDKDKILIALKQNGEVRSFVMSEPYESAYETWSAYDNGMKRPSDQKNEYYVSTIVVPPARRRKMDYFVLIRALVGELVEKRGVRNITMHAKKSNRYSERIQRFCKNSQVKRTVENFLGSKEPFDYIEMNISDEDIEKFDKLFISRVH